MAPKAAPKTDKTYSHEVVACLLAALNSAGVIVGAKHYGMMAKLDDSRTASGYEHLFRDAKNRAKEISDMIAKGEIDIEGTPAKKPGPARAKKAEDEGEGKKKTPTKRGRKSKAETEENGDEGNESPTKKVKTEEDGEGGSDVLV